MPHRGLEHASVLRLAFQSDALPTQLFPLLELPVVGLFLWVHGLDDRPAAPGRHADQHCLAYQRFPKKGQVPPDARGWLSGKAGKYIMVGYIIYEHLRHFFNSL